MDGEDHMDMAKGKKYRIHKQEICMPSPKMDAKKTPPRTPTKNKCDGVIFLVWAPYLEEINFQELLARQQIPDPNTIKSPKLKKKIQAAIKAINMAQAACADDN